MSHCPESLLNNDKKEHEDLYDVRLLTCLEANIIWKQDCLDKVAHFEESIMLGFLVRHQYDRTRKIIVHAPAVWIFPSKPHIWTIL